MIPLFVTTAILTVAFFSYRLHLRNQEIEVFRNSIRQGQKIGVRIDDAIVPMLVLQVNTDNLICKEYGRSKARIIPISFTYPL